MTSNRGEGHIGPLAPFARAFAAAGDSVLVAAPAGARDSVLRARLPFHALPDPPDEERDKVFAELAGLSHEEQGVRVVGEVFAGIDARSALPAVLRAIVDFQPDLVLRDTTEYAGLLAAERLGVRHGRIGIMTHAMESFCVPIVAPVLDRHRRRLGVRPDPKGERIHASPYLTVLPEAMEDPSDREPEHAYRFREPAPAARPLPDWWDGDERPLVYVTYGSVTPMQPNFPELFRATLEQVAGLPARVLFTVGVEVDLGRLAPAPPNVRVERWVPQADVMPHAAAMVGHGGSGSTRMALAAGVPSVVVPGFADQLRNADRVQAIGAGIALQPSQIGELGGALLRLLERPSYRRAAAAVAAEVAALPLVAEAPAALSGWTLSARAA